jgi:DNA-binding NarL/FixJ family response regulator
MPGIDGLEVILQLRREFPDVRIVAMSGGGFRGTVDMLPAAGVLGAIGVLYKPLGVQETRAAIHQALQTPVAVPPVEQDSRDQQNRDNGLLPAPQLEVPASRSTCRSEIRQVVAC